jgi:hypothetical protein
LAGDPIAILCAPVMRGTSIPFEVEVTSSIEEGSAAAPVPILTPLCANVLTVVTENTINITKQNRFLFKAGFFLRIFAVGFIVRDIYEESLMFKKSLRKSCCQFPGIFLKSLFKKHCW